MNYEKLYKDALERMKSWARGEHPECFSEAQKTAEFIFPELQESEDERIRKGLIKAVSGILKGNTLYGTDVTREEALAWLEKQEQEPKKVSIWKHWKNGIAGHVDGKQIYLTKKDNIYSISSCLGFECDYIELSELDNLMLEKQVEPKDKGEISDGYHTFNELYRYRMLYNAAFFNLLPKELVHKSKRHHDGEECFGGGWFIVMANLPTGQISNHYKLKDWNLFQVPEKFTADEWDGHTPQDAADRLHKYLLEKQWENKTIDANKVIEWLKITINETKECFGEHGIYYDTRLILPYSSIEDLINDFKEDFGL